MLTELRRCNSIGNIDGLLFLVNMLFGKKKITYNEIVNRASLEKDIKLNCIAAIAFLEYLGFVSIDGKEVVILDKLLLLEVSSKEVLVSSFVKECIARIINDGIFDSGAVHFDSENGLLNIKRSAFPLSYAAIRNFLTASGVLEKEINGEIGVVESYENDFSSILRKRKEKFTLEQLLQKQKEQSQRGLEAEEFIVEYERNRIPGKAYKIKRISDFDVSAGYDIVSFDSNDSIAHDRFVEVKSYIGNPRFYWSENEVDVARRKGEKYILCLVDYTRLKEPGYEPEFISNPYEKIFEDSTWLVNTSSYKI